VNFAAITLCVASQQVFIFVVFVVILLLVIYFFMTQSGNFLIHLRTFCIVTAKKTSRKVKASRV
jgi:hypothetical protein